MYAVLPASRSGLITALFIAFALLVCFGNLGVPFAYAGNGNAEVTRYRNLQLPEMTPQQHPPGDALVTRYRNLQLLEMTPQMHPPGDALVTRYRNLQSLEMEPVGELSTTISSFITTDDSTNPQSSFATGNAVLLRITISGTGELNIANALVSTIILNPDVTPVFLGYTYQSIDRGEQYTIYIGFQIPYDAKLGDYTAKVNILTGFPSQDGEPLIGGHAEVHFTVTSP